ncbi:MAG: PAS domain S-box protein [Ignavibacteriaceae bacterium]|nr:PAS domain S-box protein [Ignavibacteriaceae bacterium]
MIKDIDYEKDMAESPNREMIFEAEERFKTMIQNVNGYIYSVQYEEGHVVSSYHSPQCFNLTGYTREEYAADPGLWAKMIHKDDRERVFIFFSTLENHPESNEIEHRIIDKSGKLKWVVNSFSLKFDSENRLSRMDGFIYDVTAHKNAEAALNEQNSFLQNLIDTIINPIFYKDINGVYTGCNRAFEDFLGKKKSEIIGKTIFDLSSPNFAEIYHQKDLQLFKQNGAQAYTTKVKRGDGSVRDIVFNKAAYSTAEGVAGLVGVMLDITEIKEAESNLSQALHRLQELELIINKGSAVVFSWKAQEDWPVEFVSANIVQFGYSVEELLSGKVAYLNLIHPEDRSRVLDEIESFKSAGISEFYQNYRLMNSIGDYRWVDAHTWIKYNDKGVLTNYQGLIIDVTRRKKAELQLQDSESRYRTLAENSYDLIFELDQEAKVLYVSPNLHELLGYSVYEMLMRDIKEFIHKNDLPEVARTLRKEEGRLVVRFRHKEGDYMWFESAGKRYRTSKGEIRGVIVSRDVTERKSMEQRLIHTEKLIAIGEMAGMIAHEFRNSLTSIKMILQLKSEEAKLTPGEKKSFGIAINSIYHMESVIQRMLNYANPGSLEFKNLELNTLVTECIPFIEMQAAKKQIHLQVHLDEKLPQMLLNPVTIKDAVINLVLNATQAFEKNPLAERKLINVKTHFVEADRVLEDMAFSVKTEYFRSKHRTEGRQEIIISEGTECALLEVSDNAGGIDDEHLARVFDPFFTTKEKGTGLGLPIVKRTVNSHGGVVIVESTPGAGTIFKLYIPVVTK